MAGKAGPPTGYCLDYSKAGVLDRVSSAVVAAFLVMEQELEGSHFPARHWHQLGDGRIQCDVCPRWNKDLSRIFGARGLAHVSAWPGAMRPALAKLVSLAAAACRSTTTTWWPSFARYHAVVTPMVPP